MHVFLIVRRKCRCLKFNLASEASQLGPLYSSRGLEVVERRSLHAAALRTSHHQFHFQASMAPRRNRMCCELHRERAWNRLMPLLTLRMKECRTFEFE